MNGDNGKLLIYQMLPRLYGNVSGKNRPGGSIEENGCGKLSHVTRERLADLRGLGFTHVWYTGILEHATTTPYPGITHDHPDVVKGRAGSPYAIKDYYDVDPDLADDPAARRDDFRRLVDRTHAAGLGVIIDFVPNHVARQYHSDCRPPLEEDFGEQDDRGMRFRRDNNFYYLTDQMLVIGSDYGPEPTAYSEYPARATGNDVFHAQPTRDDWYDTVKLNYGVDPDTGETHFEEPVPDTWTKMYHILYYWAVLGVDGFRCDMAEMVPVPFWRWVIRKLRPDFPQLLFIGEIYQPWRYREYLDAGLDYLYDKVGLYDTLVGVLKGERAASDITSVWQSQEGLSGLMLHFMENHDEQRLASDFLVGTGAKAIPAVAVSALIDGGPMMIYFGQMLGEHGMDEEGFSGRNGRTTIYDYWSMESMRALHHPVLLSEEQQELRERYRRLLEVARYPVFHHGLFFDLMYAVSDRLDPRKQYAFLRYLSSGLALVVANFADHSADLALPIPEHAFETLRCPQGKSCRQLDLGTGEEVVVTLESDRPYRIKVRPHDYSVLLFSPLSPYFPE